MAEHADAGIGREDRTVSRRPRIVVVAADVVGRQMAGPGMRTIAIARELSKVGDVLLAVGTPESDLSVLAGEPFRMESYAHPDQLVPLVEQCDVAFCQITDENVVRRGVEAGCRFIFDLYNALPAEAIGSERIGGFTTQPGMDAVFQNVLSFFRLCMVSGSYFVTSNERQRDFWVGYMLASGGLVPSNLGGRTVEDIIGLLPFGSESEEPTASSHPIRDLAAVGADDFVLLWAGGIWDWFDAETPIRAVTELREQHPDIHLVFYGTVHPNPLVGRPRKAALAAELAEGLGVLGEGVHFIDGWVPAVERTGYLLDADVAVSAHLASFETRYAFRTRILDHFWAELPSIVTEGDWFAQYIADNDLGEVVGYHDVEGTKAAILALRDRGRRQEVREHVARVKDTWRWTETTAELRETVADWQHRLPDRRADLTPVPEVTVAAAALRTRIRRRLGRTPLGRVWRAVRSRRP